MKLLDVLVIPTTVKHLTKSWKNSLKQSRCTVGPRPEEDRGNTNGVVGVGKVTGLAPMNIPDIQVNPFTLGQIPDVQLQNGANSALPGSGDPAVGPKNAASTPTPEQIAENGAKITPESADPEVKGANPTPEVPMSMDMARRRAFLDAPAGSGPMEIRRRMNAAMGMQDEKDDSGRLTGRTFINNAEGKAVLFDDTAEGATST